MTETTPGLASEPPGGLDVSFCEALDAAPVMIWVSGADQLCKWCNRRWLEFTGCQGGEESAGGFGKVVHPDDQARRWEVYASRFAARSEFRIAYRLRRHDGQYRLIDEVAAPRYARDGSFLGYIGSCTDIEEQAAAQSSLRDLNDALEQSLKDAASRLIAAVSGRGQTEEELLQSSGIPSLLLEGIKDCAIYMLDPQGRIVSWNVGAERINGYNRAEIIGQHFSRFYMEADRQTNLPMRALSMAARDGKFEGEGWHVRKDGSQFWAHVLIDPIYEPGGKLIGFANITRDATAARRAPQLLAQAQEHILQLQKMQAIGQLTGGVAHDFNNLLTVIIGNLEIAQRHAEPAKRSAARQKRAIESALRAAQRAASLTQRLLAFSRRQPLAPKPVDVNRLIAAEVEFFQRSLGEAIEIEAVGAAGLWQVEVDPHQLEAALLNLAVNARNAMPDGGKLTIETSNAFLDEEYCRANPEVQRGQYVMIALTDNGTGMTKEVLNRAFEPLFSTKAVGEGTGLGLSQVYGFIKQSGGHVKIYSEPGEGTTVKIYLPRLLAQANLEEPDNLKEPLEGEHSETILVVEDDDDVRSYLLETLGDLNYRVLRAQDAASALRILQQSAIAIDLLLTDVVLPGMNGRELASQARALRPNLKVLFMTGYSRNAIAHQERLDPGVELLQKPITQNQLAARIRTLLDESLPRHSLR